MNQRIARTLGNWRWWVIIPICIAMLPAIAIDLMLAAFITSGEVAADCRDGLHDLVSPVIRWTKKWAVQSGRRND